MASKKEKGMAALAARGVKPSPADSGKKSGSSWKSKPSSKK
jgi:hypothetical protein